MAKKIKNILKIIKDKYKIIREKCDWFVTKYLGNMAIQAGIIAIILELIIESLGHKSFFGGAIFLFTSPLVFLLNTIIIFATLSIAWLFRRRIFVYTIVSVAWLAIGIANGVILMFRMTPFTTADLSFIELGIAILPNYFSTVQLVLLGVALVAIVLLFIAIFIFAPKRKGKLYIKRRIAGVLISILLVVVSMVTSVQTGIVATYFGNLWDAYYDYGVPYCFLSTWLNRGISKPTGYDEQMVSDALSSNQLATMSSETASEEEKKDYPNIVFLQLESFIDPDEVKNLEYEGEVVPYFKELKENYSTGHLTVPSVGGGTANTEFEVMTGMSVRSFGPGEYPYKTILKDQTCESLAYDVKKLGMGAHIMHNHRGAFYNRNTVFPNLGYDSYTSMEYMSYVTKTPRNWARDDVLISQIFGAMESTEVKDYVYAISVQGHGEYPKSKVLDDPDVVVTGEDMEEGLRYAYEYYIEQINEMDDFLRELTAELEEYEEDTVLVLYGDHLPALEMEAEDMKSGSQYDTEYVIWSNFDMKKKDMDLNAYQLVAEVQERIGMREGTLTVYHQDNKKQWGTEGYIEKLELLQYDMLYGEQYIYGGQTPFKPTKMTMGFNPIKINDIIEVGGQYYISGEGFTSFSKVSMDGEVLDTIYLSPTVLKLQEKVDRADVNKLKVSQVEKNKEILSTTE